MQYLSNGIETPTNSDAYNLTDDLAHMGETANVIIRIVSQADRDALPNLQAGVTVARMDLPQVPLERFDGAVWSVSDVQWTNLALVQGFTAYTDSGWSGLKYAVKGGVVYVNGAVGRATAWPSDQTVAVIPAALRPAHKIQGTGNSLIEPTVGNITIAAGSGSTSFSLTWPLF